MGGCFPCVGSSYSDNGVKEVMKKQSFKEGSIAHSNSNGNRVSSARNGSDSKKNPGKQKEPTVHIAAHIFTFRELAAATKNFRPECLLGEGGFGCVYKGKLESTGQVVAVKQLDRNGLQGNREFLVEVLMLSLLHHPNLVNLIGYCADGDQRLLVYEYMQLGSLEDHLHDLPPGTKPLDWNTRMKIAAGAAKGLEYLHKADPPVIYRDLKSSNILLADGYFPKLSDFGLAKLGPIGDKMHVSTRVMGTYGYCAPEYAMTGQLTIKSDVYSFGVVLLELITGRKAIDDARGANEHNLVAWARPLFKARRKFPKMVDPVLQGQYPIRGLYQALAVAAMCLQEQAATRPLIGDVVTALSYLAGPPTPRHRDGMDDSRHGAHHGSPSTHKNYSAQEFGELRRIDTGGGPGSKSGLEELESRRDSPASAGKTRENVTNRDVTRDRQVAKMRHRDGTDDPGRGAHHGSPSTHKNHSSREFGELRRIDTGGGPGSKLGLEELESQRENATNRDLDREREVALAKVWGENWRKEGK